MCIKNCHRIQYFKTYLNKNQNYNKHYAFDNQKSKKKINFERVKKKIMPIQKETEPTCIITLRK